MKVLHSAALLRPPSGILNQMMWEQEAAHQLGIDWNVRMFCPSGWTDDSEVIQFCSKVLAGAPKNRWEKARDWLTLRKAYHEWLTLQENDIDLFVLRYYVHDPFQLKFVSRCRKPVCLVHHTLEVPELSLAAGLTGKTRAFLEELIGGRTIRKAFATIGVTQEIIDYEKKRSNQLDKAAILYPNGIVYDQPPVGNNRGEVAEFLFVASYFSPWHGLDLLLNSVRQSKEKFVLHLVGELSPKDRRLAKRDTRVIMHGRKTHKEIRQLAEHCCLGLSSFALNRNKMTQACTLKVREYLMMGLPVYAGYQEALPEGFPFYFQGEPEVSKLLIFSNKVYGVSRKKVADASRPYIDKTILLENLYDCLCEHGEQRG